MPRWKKDAKEFTVGVNYVENRGYSSSIPKPVVEILGNPDSIKYVVNDDKSIQLVSGSSPVFRSETVKSKKHG
ncbi:MAG: hypothetical protein WAK50_12280 [Nitrososphaeraceae archaeon]